MKEYFETEFIEICGCSAVPEVHKKGFGACTHE